VARTFRSTLIMSPLVNVMDASLEEVELEYSVPFRVILSSSGMMPHSYINRMKRQRETDRQRQTKRDRQIEKQTNRETERDKTKTDRDRERERKR
jgi:hypothetical protein